MTLATDPSSFNMITNLSSTRFMRVLGSNSSVVLESARFNNANPSSTFQRRRERLFATSDNEENICNFSSTFQPPAVPTSAAKLFSTVKNQQRPGAFYSTDSTQEQDLISQNTFENYERIQKALQEETDFFTSASPLFQVDRHAEDKVDVGLRDKALESLRSLHVVFYGLSTEIFCKTSTLLDLFCTRIRVRTKYVTLVTAACYYIVSQQQDQLLDSNSECLQPTPSNLVQLLKCGGSTADLEKMVQIIYLKLKDVEKVALSAGTHKHFLDALYNCIANQHLCNSKFALDLTQQHQAPSLLCRKLEIALCSSAVNVYRPCCIALALLYIESLQNAAQPVFSYFPIQTSDIYRIANICKIARDELKGCTEAVLEVLAQSATDFGATSSASGSPGGVRPNGNSPPLQWTLSRRSLKAHGLLARANSNGHKLTKITEDPLLERQQEIDEDQDDDDDDDQLDFSNYDLPAPSTKPINALDSFCSGYKSGEDLALLTPMLVA